MHCIVAQLSTALWSPKVLDSIVALESFCYGAFKNLVLSHCYRTAINVSATCLKKYLKVLGLSSVNYYSQSA